MTKDEARGLGWLLGFVIVTATAVALMTGCGASARQKTVNAAFVVIDAGCSKFAEYDLAHQRQILAASADRATFDAAIGKWRATRDKVQRDCTAAYRADAVAATLDNEQSFAALKAAASIVYDEIKALGVIK